MSNPKEGQIQNLMRKHKMTRRQAVKEYKRLMRLRAIKAGAASAKSENAVRPFKDPEAARQAQARSVEKRKLNKGGK